MITYPTQPCGISTGPKRIQPATFGRWGWFLELSYAKAHYWVDGAAVSLCGRAKRQGGARFENAVRYDGTGTKRTGTYGREWFCVPCANALDKMNEAHCA